LSPTAVLEIALDERVRAATPEPISSAAALEIAPDESVPAAMVEPMPSAAGIEAVAAPAARLRDAVASVRMTPAPAPAPLWARFGETHLQARALNWALGQRVILSFDPHRPDYGLR
jgi:hypothetical protein